jgi:hypothetical protein
LLPDVEKKPDNDKAEVKKEAAKVIKLIMDPANLNITFYYFFPGLCVGFYATFLYKLIGASLHQEIQ